MDVLSQEQFIRILIIVVPVLLTVLGDGRVTRARLDDVLERQRKLELTVEAHIADEDRHVPKRRRR